MSSLERLPPDQRAVLALVLQRGRTYDEIANLLAIDRAAVRDRALAALDALGPSEPRVPPERRALITDYLLGQLPPRVRDDTRARLASSPSERAWARLLAGELSPMASNPLPEIPAAAAPITSEPAPGAAPAEPPAPPAPPAPGEPPAPAEPPAPG
ncbi:MAG TPA: sigma factor-like helix-turn-helix DNA-binding protein, partial [Solirubrobacteraceae bacterium]|nr:sigma factor-like helix-turn-helix DNA-binding protein [Solirubrobacteraceae bacterium]